MRYPVNTGPCHRSVMTTLPLPSPPLAPLATPQTRYKVKILISGELLVAAQGAQPGGDGRDWRPLSCAAGLCEARPGRAGEAGEEERESGQLSGKEEAGGGQGRQGAGAGWDCRGGWRRSACR